MSTSFLLIDAYRVISITFPIELASKHRVCTGKVIVPHNPAISIVIPVYNVEPWIRRAVGSLQGTDVRRLRDHSRGRWKHRRQRTGVRRLGGRRTAGSASSTRKTAAPPGRATWPLGRRAASSSTSWTATTGASRRCWKTCTASPPSKSWIWPWPASTSTTYYTEDKFYRETRTAPDKGVFQPAGIPRACPRAVRRPASVRALNKLYRRSYLNERGIAFPETLLGRLAVQLGRHPRNRARGLP